ncbi:MAG: ABC transporter ATP-binding protein/permease [Gammaproteobacteria bacterium]|nr:ABC transporter ATP-binding protein/permease [Gammaproteobacteria bacterium]
MSTQSQNMSSFLWKIIKPYRWWLLLMFQATIIGSTYHIVNNYALKLIIDAFSLETMADNSHLFIAITVFISAQIGLDVTWRLSDYAGWHSGPYIHRAILSQAYDYIQHHSYAYFQKHPSGMIVSKLKGILDGYQAIFDQIHHQMGRNFLTTVFLIFSLLLINTQVFFFMLVWSVFIVMVMVPMSLKLNRLALDASESKHQVMGLFSDNILNIFSLFAFAKRQEELQRIKSNISKRYLPDTVALYKYYFKLSVVGSVLYWVMLIIVFLFMIWLRQTAQISIGDFVFVMMTTLTISMELWLFTESMFDFMHSLGDFKASFSILTIPHEKIDRPNAKSLVIRSPSIEFDNIGFQYPNGSTIFEGLNLSIPAGQKVGLVGHSGAGKSTLISLLLKHFLPTQGHIYIDTQTLNDVTSDSLRAQISLIPQDILLFHRSIGENIGYARSDATLEDIQTAASKAMIHDYIETLPEKYDTLVGERGVKLSGGQRQRIAIARAILKNAPIIILDEATSSLDTSTEADIQQSIHDLLKDQTSTVIAIAHRLSTIRHMDRIVVMDGGSVIQDGSFKTLMADKKGYFRMLWDTQVDGMVL